MDVSDGQTPLLQSRGLRGLGGRVVGRNKVGAKNSERLRAIMAGSDQGLPSRSNDGCEDGGGPGMRQDDGRKLEVTSRQSPCEGNQVA